MNGTRPNWWAGHQHGRRPVPRWRRIGGIVILLLMVAGFLSYRYLTSESRLRRYAEHWLRAFSGGEAHVERVDFDPFVGLTLVGVTIATPKAADFFPPETTLDDRTIFSAGSVLLRLQPFSIILGELVVPEIIAVNPQLTLVNRLADGKGNWEVMLRKRPSGKPGGAPPRLPDIHLRNVEVRGYRLTERGRAGGAVQTLKVGAHPLPDRPEVYDLSITKIFSESDSQTWKGDTGQMQINMVTGEVSGTSLPRLSLEELRLVAPPEFNRWLDILDPDGYVWAEKFQFNPKTGARASLRLRDARLSVPVDDVEAANHMMPRYIRFSNVAGTIGFDGRRATIEMQGLFRSSPVRLNGTMTLPAGAANGLTGIGLDLELKASQVPLPRNDSDTDEAEKRFVNRWRRLAVFVRDFDGRGKVDLAVKLHKEPGEGKGIDFVEGVLTLRGPSGAFDEFPYRVHDMTGDVRFRPDGRVDLVNLAGIHAAGNVVINGQCGSTSHDDTKLEIQGRNIALDANLLDCLQEDDRGLCNKFLQKATLDLDLRLERPSTPWDQPRGKWTSSLNAVFLDGTFKYTSFPYVLDQLRGRIRIAGGTLRLDELTGRHGPATVRVSGTAARGDNDTGNLDVRLQASAVPLDEAMATALPADIRKLYERYAPQGRADIAGRLYSRQVNAPLLFDLNARLIEASLAVPGSAARLTDVSGDLQIAPERLTIRSLKGRLGRSPLTVEGSLGLTGEKPGMAVHIASDSLELTDTVRSTLPASLREAYDSMSPSGRVRLDLKYEGKTDSTVPKGSDGEQKGLTGQYTTVIEPLGCRVKFAKFPYALEDVTGTVVLTPAGLQISQLAARHGSACLKVSGCVSSAQDTSRVQLDTLDARDVPFTEELRLAVPWRMRRMWSDLKPTGTCDLNLRDIVVTRGPGDNTTWSGAGTIALKQASLTAGPEFTDVTGTLQGTVGYDKQFHFDMALQLQQVRVDGRLLTNTTAHMQRSDESQVLKIHDILGAFYEGNLLGEVEVDYSRRMPTYGVSLTAHDVSLQGFLNARRRADERPLQLQGRIDGTLALSGQIANASLRQGSGNVLIHDAQILKVPLMLSILQIVNLTADDNAFHDALLDFMVDGDDVVLDRIDLRGKALSMVGAGRVHASDTAMQLVLLIGSPLRLPRVKFLSDLLESVARELMEVHVEGTLDQPTFRADIVRSLRKSIEAMTAVRVERGPPKHRRGKE